MGRHKKEETKELAVAGNKAPIPAYLQGKADGLDAIGTDDLQIPYIKLLAHLSQEVQDGNGSEGDIINSVTKENLGTNIEFIVLDLKNTWAKFAGGECIARSKDGITWNSGDLKGDKLSGDDSWKDKVYNFFVLLTGDIKEGTPTPYILSFKSSASKNARKLKNMLAQGPKAKGVSIYAQPYVLFTSQETNTIGKKTNKWFILDVKTSSREWITEKEAKVAKEARAYVATAKEKVKDDVEVEEAPAKGKNGKNKF